jgi:hypothetical protein
MALADFLRRSEASLLKVADSQIGRFVIQSFSLGECGFDTRFDVGRGVGVL